MTETQTTSQPARGWERIVERLHEAQDAQTFLSGMLQLQCMIVAADYGAIWVLDPDNKPLLAQSWPTTLQEHGPNETVIQMLQQAAASGVTRGMSQVLKLHVDGSDPQDPNATKSLVFVTIMRSGGRIEAVSTAVAESRDTKVAKITGPMRELAAGLFGNFESRRRAEEFQNDAQNVRKAMALLAVSQEGRGFKGGCLNLVNELARQHQCTRVSVGWVRGQSVRVVAISDTDHIKRHDEQVALLEMSMSECLDQQQPLVYPVTDSTEPLLAHAVVHSHRRLTGDHPSKHALSVPLRHDDEWVGTITLERSDAPFDDQMVQKLQLVADVIAPHLDDRRRGDRFLVIHAWHSVRTGGAYLVGHKHVGWKLVALLVMSLIAFAAFGTWPYHVSAPFRLEAQDKRIIPSPYDGRLDVVMAEPGDPVKAGDLMAQLDTTELKLQLAEATSEATKTSLERSQATAEGKQAEAQQGQALLDQVRSRISLLRYHIDKARILAPIDGFVLSGYWHDKVGGMVEQGNPMFEVAPIKGLMVLVRVSEDDIDQINPDLEYTGELATRSVPEKKFKISVLKIVPLAAPVEGENVFEVRCHIDDPADWLRPGMEGLARIKIGRRRIAWLISHRIVETVRLWLWL
jgi:GAF domain-containing protein